MINFHDQATWNVNGDMLAPIVVHSRDLSDKLREHYLGRVGFVQTDDGKFNYNAIGGGFTSIIE